MNNDIISLVEKKVKIAKTRIINSSPFFGIILLSTKLIPVGDVERSSTDGNDVFYNPLFIADIDINHTAFAIEHELYHKAFMHVHRLGDRDKEIWNIACDLSVHSTMVCAGKYIDVIIDNNYYYDSQFNGKNAEEIYSILVHNNDIRKKIEEQEAVDFHNYSISGSETEKNSVSNIVRSAFKVDKSYASSSDIVILREEFFSAEDRRGNFRESLRKFFEESFSRTDYSFMERDRRFSDDDFMLPSIVKINEKDRIKTVIIGFDVSLSISKNEIQEFLDICSELSEDYCDCVHIIFCSDRIHKHLIFEDCKITGVDIPMGYATSFIPVFEYIKDNNLNPKLLLYLTDLLVSEKDVSKYDPDFNVVWVKSGPGFSYHTPRFGEVIDLKLF